MITAFLVCAIASSGQALIWDSQPQSETHQDWVEKMGSEANASYRAYENLSRGFGGLNKIVDLEAFRECYKAQMMHAKPVPHRPDGKTLLMGVFTELHKQDEQQVIRDTWMRTPGVCILDGREAPRPGCIVWALFVVGQNASNTILPPKDAVLLPIPENMNSGKTFEWFQYAARKYPWATDIAKADMDTFPWLADVIHSLDDPSRCSGTPYEYWGLYRGPCPGPFNETCATASCMKNQFCKQGMLGAMYGMSRQLAMQATQPGTPWAMRPAHNADAEDGLTGERVQEWAQTTGKCVSISDIRGTFSHKARETVVADSIPACHDAF